MSQGETNSGCTWSNACQNKSVSQVCVTTTRGTARVRRERTSTRDALCRCLPCKFSVPHCCKVELQVERGFVRVPPVVGCQRVANFLGATRATSPCAPRVQLRRGSVGSGAARLFVRSTPSFDCARHEMIPAALGEFFFLSQTKVFGDVLENPSSCDHAPLRIAHCGWNLGGCNCRWFRRRASVVGEDSHCAKRGKCATWFCLRSLPDAWYGLMFSRGVSALVWENVCAWHAMPPLPTGTPFLCRRVALSRVCSSLFCVADSSFTSIFDPFPVRARTTLQLPRVETSILLCTGLDECQFDYELSRDRRHSG